MRILVIGERTNGSFFSEILFKGLTQLGHEVDFRNPPEILESVPQPSHSKYLLEDEPFLTSRVTRQEYDLIVVDECRMHFKNDTLIPCFYTHMVAYRPLKCVNPDGVFFWTPKFLEYHDKLFSKKIMKDIPFKRILPSAVDPDIYKPKEKIYKGVNGIGYRGGESNWTSYVDLPQAPNTYFLNTEIAEFKKEGFNYFDDPISDERYRELIAQCESLWIPIPPLQWLTRRIFEAMACKTLCYFTIESKEHEEFLNSLGFRHGEHYYNSKEIFLTKPFLSYTIDIITENAYNLVLKRHTPIARAQQLLDYYEEYKSMNLPLRGKPIDLKPRIIEAPSRSSYIPKKVGLQDKNVMVLSCERTGTSWMTAVISEAHQQLYGEPIIWNAESSRIISIDPKYEIPKGYCGVYYVKPQWLVKRSYDKIIILKRDIESLIIALCRYYVPSETPEAVIENYPEFIKQVRYYYELMYGEKVIDERVMYVELSNLNNYPVHQFHEVLDFLDFPLEVGYEYLDKIIIRQRPAYIPVKNLERDWDIQGTIINKGHEMDPAQEGMIKYSGIKGMMPIVDPDLPTENYGYVQTKSQYLSQYRVNPWFSSPEEFKYQEGKVYRIKPNLMMDALDVLGYIKNDGVRVK